MTEALRSRSPLQSLVATDAFRTYFTREASAGLRKDIRRSTSQFGRIFLSNPTAAFGGCKPVTYLRGVQQGLKELKLNETHRAVILSEKNRVVLLRGGNHALIDEQLYKPHMLRADIASERHPLSSVFIDALFPSVRRQAPQTLSSALDPQWAYALSRQQQELVDSIVGVASSDAAQTVRIYVVYGGPGTGKTSVLLKIADDFGWDPNYVQIGMSTRMKEYIESGLNPGISDCFLDWRRVGRDSAVLLDDPHTWKDVVRSVARAKERSARLIVVATDVGQLNDVVSDDEFTRFLRSPGVEDWPLTECYRQKADVGRAALRYMRSITEKFTKHIFPDRIAEYRQTHSIQDRLSNRMTFSEPGGHWFIHDPATPDALRMEVDSLRSGPLWRHWPPLLVVTDSATDHRRFVGTMLHRIKHDEVDIEQIEEIRGLEYLKLPRFSGHLQRLDRDSRQEVWHEEARTEGV